MPVDVFPKVQPCKSFTLFPSHESPIFKQDELILSASDRDEDQEFLFLGAAPSDSADGERAAEREHDDGAASSAPGRPQPGNQPGPGTSGLGARPVRAARSRARPGQLELQQGQAHDEEASSSSEDDSGPPAKSPPLTFSCVDCGHDCGDKKQILTHRRQQHREKRPFQCPYSQCGKCFMRSNDLEAHVRIHTGEKPFRCCVCGASFNKGNLHTHMMTHTGEKPYSCNECGAHFALKETLVRHMRTHTGEKPFRCPTCFKSFSVRCNLKKHVITHR